MIRAGPLWSDLPRHHSKRLGGVLPRKEAVVFLSSPNFRINIYPIFFTVFSRPSFPCRETPSARRSVPSVDVELAWNLRCIGIDIRNIDHLKLEFITAGCKITKIGYNYAKVDNLPLFFDKVCPNP